MRHVLAGLPPLVTLEQFTAILVAMAGLITAVTALWTAVRRYHSAVDGRMSEILLLAQLAAKKEGELAGRDFIGSGQPKRSSAE